MAEHQLSLSLDSAYSTAPEILPDLRDEIAGVWGLPLGERVEVCFRGADRSSITGILELVVAPDYPWDSHKPIRLKISGFVFSSLEIDRWTRF
jgi:hypothetical protein